MNAIDFIEEWNRTHSCSPSFQDAINWAEEKLREKDSQRTWTIIGDDVYDFPWADFHFQTSNIDKQGLIDYAKARMIEGTGKYSFALEYGSLLSKLTSDQLVKHLSDRFGAEIVETTGLKKGSSCIWFDPEMETDAEYTIASCPDKKDISYDSIILLSNGKSEAEVLPNEIFVI